MDLYSNYNTGNKYLNDFIAEYSERKLKHSDYLQHYGVLGMKWGVRHDKERTGLESRIPTDPIGRQIYNMQFASRMRKRTNKLKKLRSDAQYKKVINKMDTIMDDYRKRAIKDKKLRKQIVKATGYEDQQKWVNDVFSGDSPEQLETQMDILSDALPALDSEYLQLSQERQNIYKKYMH